jgi:hypothetical protein
MKIRANLLAMALTMDTTTIINHIVHGIPTQSHPWLIKSGKLIFLNLQPKSQTKKFSH